MTRTRKHTTLIRQRVKEIEEGDFGIPDSEMDLVDQESRESFPASDAPSWTPVTGSRNKKPSTAGK